MRLMISSALLRRIEQQGEASYPEECAGVLLGRAQDGALWIQDALALENSLAASQRQGRYQIDAGAMMQAEWAADERGLEVLGVFHSHPDGPSRPSDFDRDEAVLSFTYLITSIERGSANQSQAWHPHADRTGFDEIPIQRDDGS